MMEYTEKTLRAAVVKAANDLKNGSPEQARQGLLATMHEFGEVLRPAEALDYAAHELMEVVKIDLKDHADMVACDGKRLVERITDVENLLRATLRHHLD